MCSTILQIINDAISQFVPVYMSKKKKQFGWMTRKTMMATKLKSRWWSKYKESNNYNDYIEYKGALNRATINIKGPKRSFKINWQKTLRLTPKHFRHM